MRIPWDWRFFRGRPSLPLRLALLLLLAAWVLPATPATPKGPPAEDPQFGKVFVGYVFRQPQNINFALYTHLCHAFVVADENGKLRPSKTCPSRQLVHDAHKANVKVLLSLGGWGWDRQFSAIVQNAEAEDRYVQAVMAIVDQYDYDGIDLDWEYPDTREKIVGFDRLCRRFRKELDDLGQRKGRHLFQTMAASASPGTLRWLSNKLLLETMDWVNVMTYDYTVQGSAYAGHHSPLFASAKQPGTPHSTELTMKHLGERGLPADRLAVGLPLYGRGFAAPEPYAATKRTGKGQVRGGNYVAIERLIREKGWLRYWDDETKNPWAIAPDHSAVIGYDDAKSLSLRAAWAMRQGFRGVFFWEINGDRVADGHNPLQEAAHKTWMNPDGNAYRFDRTVPREVLEAYLSRAITMEGLLNGRGDLEDNLRMLKDVGAKFIGRSLCLWAGEAALLGNLQRARQQIPRVHQADPDMILQACIFEIVTTQVESVPVPEWAFTALGLPVEKRTFRYADMLYPGGKFRDHWRKGSSVPDVSRPETRLWFYFLAASFIDLGFEAIHFGQVELMNRNDRDLRHYSELLSLIRAHAAKHARRHMVLCDAHVPSGGLVRAGHLLMDFHSFPLRIKEVSERPEEAVLQVGFSDGIYGRSKGGLTFSGWKCEHLPYLVELDNWGVSRQPGKPSVGGIWIWGYDEISWFAHQSKQYRSTWLRYAWDWVRRTDPSGYLQMPGSRTVRSPLDRRRWYFANTPGPAVPDGLGDEETIKAIWADDSKK